MKKRTLVILIVVMTILIALGHIVPVKQKTGPGTYGFQVSNNERYSILKGEMSAYNDSTKCDFAQACDPHSPNIITHRLYIW